MLSSQMRNEPELVDYPPILSQEVFQTYSLPQNIYSYTAHKYSLNFVRTYIYIYIVQLLFFV